MRTFHVCMMILALCGGTWAQAPAESTVAPAVVPLEASQPAPEPPVTGGPSEAPVETGEPAPESPATVAPVEAPVAGDTVKLKSGAVLRGVQVVRQTPMGYEILAAGEVKFTVPRKLVDHIEFDGVEAEGSVDHGEKPAEEANLIQGDKVDPEMWKRLNNPLGEPVQEFDNQDMVSVIDTLSKRTEVPIAVDEPVGNLPVEKRAWTLKTTPETTLRNLLQQELPKSFPDLKVVYQFDKILVTLREQPASTPKE
jgi:hypothetical protein